LSSMKAALIDRYGSNDVVKVADIAVPVMGPVDLLVHVHAAGVNPVDVRTRDGQLKTSLKYRFPLVLGNDLSGVVADVGAQVTRFKRGWVGPGWAATSSASPGFPRNPFARLPQLASQNGRRCQRRFRFRPTSVRRETQ
jgi:NADPH:quinone reductase-like Zn-dependent oxidoreductase